MGIFNNLFKPKNTSNQVEDTPAVDAQLLQVAENPQISNEEFEEDEDVMQIVGTSLFTQLLEYNFEGNELPRQEVALKETTRMRLQAGPFTLWVFDFNEKDDFGFDGKALFIQTAKLPRQFMPKQKGRFQTIREYIIQRDAIKFKVNMNNGSRQERTYGYYFGIMEFPDKPSQLEKHFPKDAQDRLLSQVWGSEHEPGPSQPSNNSPGVAYISLEGNPEKVAEGLIQDSLPKTFLNEIDISTDEGFSQLFACLMLRKNQCSLEKDEIVAFTKRNEQHLEEKLSLMRMLTDNMKMMDDETGQGLASFFDYFVEHVEHCRQGNEHLVNIKSDRLLWLVYALASQLSSEKISYTEAKSILAKPVHKNRISELSLQFMLYDFAGSIGKTTTPPPEYVMLIVECALMTGQYKAASAGIAILPGLPVPAQKDALIYLLHRSIMAFEANGIPASEASEYLNRLRSRFDDAISDDDL